MRGEEEEREGRGRDGGREGKGEAGGDLGRLRRRRMNRKYFHILHIGRRPDKRRHRYLDRHVDR